MKAPPALEARGPRVRMRKALLDAALDFTSRGLLPSVSEVAEAAQVSRATAYRYFPSQAALVQAVTAEALGPILQWQSERTDPVERIGELIAFAYPRMEQFEAPLRAAIRLGLDQWARKRAGTLGNEPQIVRGNRIPVLRRATEPLKTHIPPRAYARLVQALALLYGSETMVVLKDMFGLNGAEIEGVAEWAARALVSAALTEAKAAAPARRMNGARRNAAAKRGA